MNTQNVAMGYAEQALGLSGTYDLQLCKTQQCSILSTSLWNPQKKIESIKPSKYDQQIKIHMNRKHPYMDSFIFFK